LYSWTGSQVSDVFKHHLFTPEMLDLKSLRQLRLVCKSWKSWTTIPTIAITSFNIKKYPVDLLAMVQSARTVRFAQTLHESPFSIAEMRPIFAQIYHPASKTRGLVFQGCAISPAVAAFVADELGQNSESGKILSLKFYASGLDDFGVTTICNALQRSLYVKEVSFCDVKMGDLGARALANLISAQTFEKKLQKRRNMMNCISAPPERIGTWKSPRKNFAIFSSKTL
jgi:hypothetical protein